MPKLYIIWRMRVTHLQACKAKKSEFKNKTYLLLLKGVYPYDYVLDFQVSRNKSPTHISVLFKVEWQRNRQKPLWAFALSLESVWNAKNLSDHHDIYLKSDVILLADPCLRISEIYAWRITTSIQPSFSQQLGFLGTPRSNCRKLNLNCYPILTCCIWLNGDPRWHFNDT